MPTAISLVNAERRIADVSATASVGTVGLAAAMRSRRDHAAA